MLTWQVLDVLFSDMNGLTINEYALGGQSELQGKPDDLKWQLIVRLSHHLPNTNCFEQNF